MTRKKAKRRPVAGLNPVARAVSGAMPLDHRDGGYTQMAAIQAHQAALAFAQNRGTPSDAAWLASAFNVTALLVANHGHGAEHKALFGPWREAIANFYQRADGRGGVGELAAVSRGLELHDALLATVTLAEMSAVLPRLKELALAGELMESPT